MQKKVTPRQNRVAAEIKKLVSEFLLRDSHILYECGSEGGKLDPRLISVTDVVVSPCLQHAKIYVAPLDAQLPAELCLDFLEKCNKQVRHHVGANLRLKFTPELVFFLDNTFNYAQHIEELLQKCHNIDSQN